MRKRMSVSGGVAGRVRNIDCSTSAVKLSRVVSAVASVPAISSAAARVNPPTKTESRANSSRSGSESRLKLQSMVARRVV